MVLFLQTKHAFPCNWVKFSSFFYDAPFDFKIRSRILKFPYMGRKCCCMFFFSLLKTRFVSIISLFERVFCEASVCFNTSGVVVVVLLFYCCLVHNTFCGYTCPIKGAGWVPTVAPGNLIFLGRRLQHLSVVLGYFSLNVKLNLVIILTLLSQYGNQLLTKKSKNPRFKKNVLLFLQ